MTANCLKGHPLTNLPRADEPPGLNHKGQPMRYCKVCDEIYPLGPKPPEPELKKRKGKK